MSWYDEDYRQRAAISVPNSAGSATLDIDVTIPEDWDAFWDVIDSSGNGLRVTGADGRTLLSYDVDKPGGGAFSAAARQGRIRIDGAAMLATADATGLLWLYFDVDVAVDASVAVTMSGSVDGYIHVGLPAGRITSAAPQPPGLQRPQRLDSKSAGAQEYYAVDVGPVLQVYARALAKRAVWEEVRAVLVTVLDDNGTPAASMDQPASMRFVEVIRGRVRRMFVLVKVHGGTSGDRYTVSLAVQTQVPSLTAHRIINQRFGLAVYDAIEPAG